MSEINNNILESHYSNEVKIKRPQFSIAEAPSQLPKHTLFSEKEANKKINELNTDIYENTKKEKVKNDFNKNLYFKIFGCIAATTAGIAAINRFRKGK